ncbi:hypothetical protein LIER_38843 [Lithospermum erythrorhizon]|uniref:Disease resistance protein n=1 Tax=Lithospermum erythrorhizon TaxID=34254 RepID=A0AAV3Q819_LITER
MDMASVAVELALNQAFSVLVDHEFISNVEKFQKELHLLVANLKMVKSFLLDAESKNLEAEAVKVVSEMVDRIKDINLSLESICLEAVNIGIIQLIKNPIGEHELCLIGSYIHKGEILGRENDVMKLTDMLVNSDNQKDFSVVSIVGIGGHGKTSL